MVLVNILGTKHTLKKYKNKVIELIRINPPDLILIEGIGDCSMNCLLKEPLLCSLPLFFKIILFFSNLYEEKGSEFDVARKLSKEKNITLKNIDISFYNLVKLFHKPYNYIFLLIPIILTTQIFKFYELNSIAVYFSILIATFICCSIVYVMGFFIHKINNARNKNFINQIIKNYQLKKYKKILIICGKKHVKEIKKGLLINNIKSNLVIV